MMLFGLGFGELIAAGTLVYVLCVAAFNAGYYSKIGGRFIELFSFADMLGANVPIFQYFLSLFAIYGTLTFPLAWHGCPVREIWSPYKCLRRLKFIVFVSTVDPGLRT